jgi:hypothetical protein
MKEKQPAESATGATAQQPYRIRLPGFVRNEDIGLGDLVKRTTASLAIKPCGGCARRAATLNRWLTFTGHR